ncbi:MAG: dienelactone hydrolase family protein [Alphaproteobacteria bacterium]|nr:dienelactone hydrolase family protein [Alphaproteobacteria bacterium]
MTQTPKITQEMVLLYDEYTHVTLDRRRFMDRMTKLAGSTAAAAAIVPLLEANYAHAAMVAADDSRLKTETVTIPGAEAGLTGYLAIPANAAGKLPGVVVIHENRGLNPHIQDVARRAALEGFVALAPDFLSPVGGTPDDQDKARDMIRALDGAATVNNAVAAAAFLDAHAASTGKTGAVGFCWGGGMVNQLAVHSAQLDAGVAFYGRQPDSADVPKIRARMLLHYAGLDERINKGIADYEAALKAAGVDYTVYMYDNVNHAFHNDTSETRYDAAAAKLAWSRTIAFFKEALA